MLCLHQVLELFCQLAEPEKIVGDLWKELHVASGVTGEAGNHLEKAVPSWEKSPFRARAYTVFISRKKYSPLHTVLVFYWFSVVSSVKGWISKYSHGRWMLVKGGKSKPSHGKTHENQVVGDRNDPCVVNTWKSKPSHSNWLKIRRKKPSCEGVNAFFEDKKAYRGMSILGAANGKLHRILNRGFSTAEFSANDCIQLL